VIGDHSHSPGSGAFADSLYAAALHGELEQGRARLFIAHDGALRRADPSRLADAGECGDIAMVPAGGNDDLHVRARRRSRAARLAALTVLSDPSSVPSRSMKASRLLMRPPGFAGAVQGHFCPALRYHRGIWPGDAPGTGQIMGLPTRLASVL
jgi:hypothetical protein